MLGVLSFAMAGRLNELTVRTLRKGLAVRVIPVVSRLELDALVHKADPEVFDATCSLIAEDEAYRLWNCSIHKKGRERRHSGTCAIIEVPGKAYVLVSFGSRDFFVSALLPFADALFPAAARIFLRSIDLLRILKRAEEELGTPFQTRQAVLKRKFGERRRTDVKFFIDPITARDLFPQAREEGAWIDSIVLNSGNGAPQKFSVNRSGIVRIYRGSFDEVFTHIVLPTIGIGLNEVDLFQHRSRSETKQPAPLLVSFVDDIFSTADSRTKFVNKVAEFQYSIHSVSYQGNPHIYVNVQDRLDRSSFTMRTVSEKELVLTPQIRCTSSALMRFAKYLVDNFDGAFEDLKK